MRLWRRYVWYRAMRYEEGILQIRVISRSGSSALIEWVGEDGYPRRSIVPEGIITGSGKNLQCENPEEGIPYGEPWATFAEATLDAVLLENLLHKSGIWTAADLASNPGAVLDAFRSAYAMDAQKLRENVRTRKGV